MSGSVEERAAIASGTVAGRLTPYVPRISLEWLAETPQARYKQIEGSLAFVDISGFTHLTERLSRKGKVGAEEINDLLDECFTELLSVAYGYGAGVVKWGGDAVLLMFDGEGHEVRACRAAWEMQSTIRSAGRLRTSSGLVTLRMSLGIHSGLFDVFLVGDLHRELVITGPGATTTVEMESLAAAGEIALSSSTAAALDPRCIGQARGPAVLLKRGPAAGPQPAAAVGRVAGMPLELCIPVDVREHLLAGHSEAEHRPLTAAFIQFGGADELLETRGPEALADALEICLSTVERIAHEHQVAFFDTDIAPGGGKIMLIAGAPTSAGNDEERMLRAMSAVIAAGGPLPLRIGINRGRIFVADFGPPYRRTYSVKGDAVNLAARLMAKAAPGQILATDDVLERLRTRFDVVVLEPFTAKGKAEPVHAYAVGRVLGAKEGDSETAPLIGREQELGALLTGLDLARNGRGSIVEVVGEPGMGKSRLVEELRRNAGDVPTFSVQCDEYEASTPYFSFREILRQVLDLPPDDHAAWADRLGRLVDETAPHLGAWLPLLAVPLGIEVGETPETARLDDEARRQLVEGVTRKWLVGLLPQPTLFVFEDTHWLDDASAGILRQLLSGLAERPWLIVVACRDEPARFVAADASVLTRLHLEPLDADQADALVHAVTDELPLPPAEVAALARRAGGNPFFLRELLSAARASGGIAELPDSVEALMMARIDRLAPADRKLLRCASVIGSSFTNGLFETCFAAEQRDAELWNRLAEFVVAEGGGHLRFRHALIRDAAYEGLPYRRRRELHEVVGETLERSAGARPEEEAEHLSLHFFQAHDFEKAWRYSRLAGERAQALYANVEATVFYERALTAGRHLDRPGAELAAVAEALGDVCDRGGSYTKAGEAFQTARRLLADRPVDEARLLRKQAWTPERLGRYSQAIRWISRADARVDGLPGLEAARQRAQLRAWRASIRFHQGRYQDVLRSCRQAIEEAEASGEKDALALAYCLLDYAYVALGRGDEACYSQLALAIYEELGNLQRQATVLNDLGAFAYWQGRWNEATELYERGRELRERVGNPVYAADGTNNIAEVLVDQGRFAEAEPLVLAALRVYQAAGFRARIAVSKRYLGRIAASSGRFDEARALLEEARSVFVDVGAQTEVSETDGRLAECLLMAGDPHAALLLLHEALARAARNGFERLPMLKRLYAHGCAQMGDLDGARRALEDALEVARARAMQFECALALDGLARLDGSPDHALERDAILARLGVISVTEIPLGSLLEIGPATSRPDLAAAQS